jgi:glycosyltransferase involved in cell wall biosynthesis
MRPIRVLFVLTSPVRGGVEEVALGLLQRLDRAEFEPAVAAPASLLEAFGPALASARVPVLAVQVEDPRRVGELRRLAAFMRRLRPDVVNPHLFRSTLVAAPLARALGIPVVETYHGREGWRQGRSRGAFLPDRLVGRLLDRAIAVSEAAREFLIRVKRYPADRVVVVPNGRDLAAFRPGRARPAVRKELGLDTGAPVVGVVGRLEAQKGHVHLLAAWLAVRREFPDARLLVVGEGSERAALEARARASGLADSVLFLGFRTDVPRLLDAVDVLALPSLYEGMPLTAIEASAMARPVVATAVDGTPEVVRDGVTGLLVPPADPPALAQAIGRLLRDPDRAAEMGRRGRAWVLDRFDVDAHVRATAAVYRDVAARRPAPIRMAA